MSLLSDLAFEARVTARSVADYVTGNGLRLGVTGLSRAGKTVFITALVQALTVRGARLPVFRAAAEGRITRGFLQPQPDDAVPRFAVEDLGDGSTVDGAADGSFDGGLDIGDVDAITVGGGAIDCVGEIGLADDVEEA